MTTTKSAPLDYASGRPSRGAYLRSSSPAPTVREGDDHSAHLLRLVLDLQLDALLLGLGAAAVQESRSHPSPVPGPAADPPGTAPWPRWAMEDIDLARALAAETVTSGAALPATLGPEPAAQEEPVVLDRLAARYESMRNLLADLLARTGANLPAAGHSHLHELMAHCQKRLVELRSVARSTTAYRSGSPRPGEHEYLPGELLG
jgi:hypothetical protein